MKKIKERAEMQVICAYCGEYIGEMDGKGIEGISHGICETCYQTQMAELEMVPQRIPALVS